MVGTQKLGSGVCLQTVDLGPSAPALTDQENQNMLMLLKTVSMHVSEA